MSTVTLLFTDVVGSTELHARLGDDAVDALRRRHFELLSGAVREAGGHEVKRMGDGIMAVFGSAVEAVGCAVAIQLAVTSTGAADEGTIAVRVGLNAGEVTEEAGDYYGTAVNVAARLCQAASGGQILASDLVRGLVGNRGGHRFRTTGPLKLKGLAEPVTAWNVFWRPEPESIAATPASANGQHLDVPLPIALNPTIPAAFVGRTRELARLDEMWEQVGAGQQRLVLVAGEPGIGKTRLCGEFCGRIHGGGGLILYGRSDEEAVVPYQPFAEAISNMLANLSGPSRALVLQDAGPELSRLVPRLEARVDAGEVQATADPETERFRLFESVASVLATVARSGPAVLVVDDLHWADKPSLLLLRHLARSSRLERLLILGTYRETDLDRRHPLSAALGDLRREPGYERILLRGLSAGEVREVMEAGAGHRFSGRGVSVPEAIHRETEGNPFFVAEVVRHLIEIGKFYRRDGVWVYDAPSAAELGLPEGVRDVISRRLGRLSERGNQVLAQASVVGREFEFDVLAAMVASEDDALAAVEEASERGLLVESRGHRAASYAFTHALVRQTLYEEMSMPRKQKLHLRAAEAIEKVHQRDLAPHIAALAVHYRTAGAAADTEKTIDYSMQAGRSSYAASAYEEALVHLAAALQLMEEEGVGGERKGQVLEQLGDVMHITGTDRPKGIVHLERALTVYEELGRVDRSVLIQSRLGRAYSSFPVTMNIPRAFDHYRAAEAQVKDLPDNVARGYLYVGIAAAGLWGTRIAEGLEAANRAVSIAEATHNDALWANAAGLKGWFLCETGRMSEGRQLVDEAWRAADRIGHVMGGFFDAWLLWALGWYSWNFKESLNAVERELDSGRLTQIPELSDFLLQYDADTRLQLGDAGPARAFGRDHLESTKTLSALPFLLPMVDGDWDGAARTLEAEWSAWKTAGVKTMAWPLLSWLGFLRQVMGDTGAATSALDEAMDMCKDMNSALAKPRICTGRAVVYLEVGERDRARELIELVRRDLNVDEWGRLKGHLAEIDAELHLCDGDVDQAEELFRTAIAAADAFPHPIFDAEFRLRWGRALSARGEHTAAVEHFDAAIETYRRFDFGQRWIDRAEAAR